ncbi:NUDIX hydrolase [Brevibacillus ginsengisoli]|uniref:NUDIX hydrolase n=1 Tax=Brevibacillus ginsengisoli TaxID=363854 RepID=UPI003CF81D46
MEYLDVYDEKGNKTGDIVERTQAHKNGICHKVIHVWVINSKNELLLQKRSKNKDLHPDKWYVSLGGHITSGEDNKQTIIREFNEELGLDVSKQIDDVHYLYTFKELIIENDGTYIDHSFYDVHLLRIDHLNVEELIFRDEEVQEAKFVTYDDFKRAVQNLDKDYWIHREGFSKLFTYLDQYSAENS